MILTRAHAASSRGRTLVVRRRALAATEMVAALSLALATVALAAYALHEVEQTRRANDTRRALRVAVDARLTALRAGLDEQPRVAATELPRGTEITVVCTPGQGPWSGLTCVTVTARRVQSRHPDIVVTLAGYVPDDGARRGGR